MGRRGHNEGTIYERKDATGKVIGYRAQLRLPDGTRRNIPQTKTRREAQRALTEAKAALLQGRLGPSTKQTVKEYLEGWLATVRPTVRDSTYHANALNVRRILPHMGHIRLDALKPAHVQNLYTALLERGLSERSVQQCHMVLHKALSDAMRLDLVVRNVTEAVSVPRPKRKERPTYTATELAALFGATEGDRFHALWVILGTTGLRIGEALGLRWSDIDTERRQLVVRRALVRLRNGGGLDLAEPKTSRSRRTVQLGDLACAALQAHRERQAFERRAVGIDWQERGLVFCTRFGTPLDQGRIHAHWRRAIEKSGLRAIRIHDLRHTVATLMLEQGEHPKVVQECLGHSSIALTMDTYSHVAPTMQREAMDRLDALIARPATGT